jgi:hypothetical protein
MTPHDFDQPTEQENQLPAHSHSSCGNLFGCGEEKGTGVFREDIKDAAFTKRAADRLSHMDEMNREQLDGYLNARGRSRRSLLRASSFMCALAGIGPWFNKLTNAKLALVGDTAGPMAEKEEQGRVHVVESNDKTVRLGVYDTTLEPILKVDSGDTISYVNTWSHFLNQMQPGVPVEALAKLRGAIPDTGRTRSSALSMSTMPNPATCSRSATNAFVRSIGERYSIIRGRSAPVCWPRISPTDR